MMMMRIVMIDIALLLPCWAPMVRPLPPGRPNQSGESRGSYPWSISLRAPCRRSLWRDISLLLSRESSSDVISTVIGEAGT
jgi:hypothetical protein